MEMLELAAELKWCRERIDALEVERDASLAMQRSMGQVLDVVRAERDQLRAENARLIATLKLIADHYDASDRQIALVEAALAADGGAEDV